MPFAGAVLATLALTRASGFWGYLLRRPGALDGTSVELWLSRALGPALLAAALWLVALGLGRRVLRALAAAPREGLDEIAAAALGLGLLGSALFALAAAGALRPAPMAVLALAAAALAAAELRPPAPPRPRLGAATGACAGLLAYAAFAAFLRAAAPPTDWDVLAYHLPLPELALQAGRLADPPWLLHSHWPHLMETLYALPLSAAGDGAAALLHLGAAALLAGGVFLAGRRAAGPAAGWCAALLLVGQPAFLREAGQARADVACALFAFASAWLLAREGEGRAERRLLAAGLLAGFCAAAKLTGLAAIAGGAAFLLVRKRAWRPAAFFLGAAALAVGPWLLKTWCQTGNPVWPFLSQESSAAALAARYLRSNRWDFPPPSWLLGHDGPLYLLLPAAGLALLGGRAARRAPALERVLWFCAPFYLIVCWRHHEAWRFLMPVWPALALGAGRDAAAALAAGGPRRAAAVLLVAAGAAPIALVSPNNELFAVIAPRPESAPDADRRALFEERAVDAAGFYRETRAVLPPEAKVLLFREIRGYGAGFDYLWGDPMNQALIDYKALPDARALRARLKILGVTHVLDHPGSTLYQEDPGYYDRRTLELMAAALKRGARPVLAREGFVLYQLL